ncbi:unnamed protein product [Rhizoctonia solani]|uniref:Uncharacterized protein n=1 Tax=Rhizoctonia solani TaxID=456999 RepID=A0A8H2WKZ5_9AGAM|nr:unnamed protein product [Rhizoctonia solani]
MRTQGELSLADSDEDRASWETSPSDSKASQRNHDKGLLVLRPNEQAQGNQVNALGNTTNPISPCGMPLRVMMSIWKVFQIILMAYLVSVVLPNAIFESYPTALCNLPILSGYPCCAGQDTHIITPDFVALAGLQSRLQHVMEHTTGSSKVAVDIKDSEMALRDLGTLVRQSTIASKEALGRDIKLFVDEAKLASGSLQRFGSHVWGAVDRTVSLNERTLVMLEAASTGRGDVTAQRKGLELLWLQSIELMGKNLRRLIHEAQDNIGSLERLTERLNIIQDMVSTERGEINEKEHMLRQQWFRELFGMNEGERYSNGVSLRVLQTVQDNREHALHHVADTLLKLNQMSNDLDDLRERVATPLIVGDSSNTPIEDHIASMRVGTKQLENGQIRMREIEDEYRRKKFTSD